jgi:hypothetical protein
MEELMNYVKPELLIVSVVLYFLGMWLKQAAFVPDKLIPLTLGIAGIFICGIWVCATSQFANAQDVAMAVFASLTQGILVAGASTYVNQLIKQADKDK